MRTETLDDPRSARVDEEAEKKQAQGDSRKSIDSHRTAWLQPKSERAESVVGSEAPSGKRRRRIMPYKTDGADHRGHYRLKVEVGLALSLAALIALTSSPIYPRTDMSDYVVASQQVIQIEDVQQTKQELPPPPPPRPPVPIAVADATILEDDELNLDATLDISEAVADIPLPPPPVDDVVEEQEQEIFVIVEEMPVLIGGIQALMKEVEYPPLARQAGVEGRVIIQLVVDENGMPKNPIVLRGIGGGCDEEAVRAVMTMKFKPGKQRGRPVPVQYSMSVLFQLKKKK